MGIGRHYSEREKKRTMVAGWRLLTHFIQTAIIIILQHGGKGTVEKVARVE